MAPVFYKYTKEEEESILERVKKYALEALRAEEEEKNKYKKLVLIVDNEDYIIFEKLRKNKHRTLFFRELLEAYYSIYFLKNNLYENKEIITYNNAIKKNVELLNNSKNNVELQEAIRDNIIFIRLKLLDEIEFWLGDIYKQCNILKNRSKTNEIWSNKI